MTLISRLTDRSRPLLIFGADLLDLWLRLYVAHVFLLSGLTKLRDWNSTLALFHADYHVPLLPPDAAAVLGTFGEVAFPVFLALGLGSRVAALGLGFVNVVAVVSYWQVLSTAEAALAQHFLWGTMLLVILLHGPGRISLDHLLARRYGLAAPSERAFRGAA